MAPTWGCPVAPASAALSDRYRVARELGEGGMATVYLAEDLRHARKVALKVLKPELAGTLRPGRVLPIWKYLHGGSIGNL